MPLESNSVSPAAIQPKLYRFKIYLPTPYSKGTTDIRGGEPLHVWYGRPHLSTDWPYCFRYPDFPCIREWQGSKCRFWVRKSANIGFFRPSKFLGARMNTSIRGRLFQAYRVVWQSFAKIGPGTSKNRWTAKKEKIARPKHSSLPLSRATVITIYTFLSHHCSSAK